MAVWRDPLANETTETEATRTLNSCLKKEIVKMKLGVLGKSTIFRNFQNVKEVISSINNVMHHKTSKYFLCCTLITQKMKWRKKFMLKMADTG